MMDKKENKLLAELETLPSFQPLKNLLLAQFDQDSDAIQELMPEKHCVEYDKYEDRYHKYDISEDERYDFARDELLSGITGEGYRYSFVMNHLEDVANFIYAIAKEVTNGY